MASKGNIDQTLFINSDGTDGRWFIANDKPTALRKGGIGFSITQKLVKKSLSIRRLWMATTLGRKQAGCPADIAPDIGRT